MARVTTVDHARKDQGKCGKCGTEITKGDPYRHASPGFRSRKLVRCMKPECLFRPSDLTTSKMADVYAAQEQAQDALDALGDFEAVEEVSEILNECAEAAREVAQEYADAAEAMGGAGEELTERGELIEAWCDELDSASFDDPPTDPDADGEDDLAEDPDPDADEDEAVDYDEAMAEWREGVLDEARAIVDGLEA